MSQQPTNDGTSTTGRVSLTPHKATKVVARPSSFVPQNRTPNSQHLFVSQRAVVCNTQAGILPTSLLTSRDQVNLVAARRKRQTPLNDISNVVGNHYLPTSGDQITPVAATRKRKSALNDSSRVMTCKTKKVATIPSSISLMQTPTSGNSIVSPGGVLCNTINNVNRSILASNSWPSSGNPVAPLAAATLALQTPVVGRVTQCSKKASTTGVTTTIPGTQTRNLTYKVGKSSRRPKRSKRLPLQSDTPVRFNLDDADGNVRKVYDKHVGISKGYLQL
ncbi:hypothetical protein Tco_1406942 [Tanacetum coccineum]